MANRYVVKKEFDATGIDIQMAKVKLPAEGNPWGPEASRISRLMIAVIIVSSYSDQTTALDRFRGPRSLNLAQEENQIILETKTIMFQRSRRSIALSDSTCGEVSKDL
jgi:hypothetical protein